MIKTRDTRNKRKIARNGSLEREIMRPGFSVENVKNIRDEFSEISLEIRELLGILVTIA